MNCPPNFILQEGRNIIIIIILVLIIIIIIIIITKTVQIQELETEIARMWQIITVVILVVVGALGVIKKGTKNSFTKSQAITTCMK